MILGQIWGSLEKQKHSTFKEENLGGGSSGTLPPYANEEGVRGGGLTFAISSFFDGFP